MSNEYQGRIARQQGIVVSRPNNKKGEASALEVTLPICSRRVDLGILWLSTERSIVFIFREDGG